MSSTEKGIEDLEQQGGQEEASDNNHEGETSSTSTTDAKTSDTSADGEGKLSDYQHFFLILIMKYF